MGQFVRLLRYGPGAFCHAGSCAPENSGRPYAPAEFGGLLLWVQYFEVSGRLAGVVQGPAVLGAASGRCDYYVDY